MKLWRRRRVLSVTKDEQAARKILEHLDLPSQVPPLGAAAVEPQGDLWPPTDKLALPPVPADCDQYWSDAFVEKNDLRPPFIATSIDLIRIAASIACGATPWDAPY
jgi:hypothetical protein